MANILVLTANLGRAELHKSSGGAERTTTLIEALTDHNVVVLSFGWDSKNINQVLGPNLKHIHLGVDHSLKKAANRYTERSASNNRDLAIPRFFNNLKDFRNKLAELLPYTDLVIVDHASAAPFMQDITDTPILYNSHNCEITMARQLYPAGCKDIQTVFDIEASALHNSVAFTYCSKADLTQMVDAYGVSNKTSMYVPNGGPKSVTTPADTRKKSKQIMFVGSGHPPNGVAAKNILPIAEAMPDYTFNICGDAGGWVKGKLPENVRILGRVSDEELDKQFKESFAFINPMESGSGTHLKMMKALGYAIPIITSTVGARGFEDAEIASSMLIANTTEENVLAIRKLEDAKTMSDLISGGEKVFVNYDWETVKSNYSDFVSSLVKSKPVAKPVQEKKKEKVLIYSIIRNNAKSIERYHRQLKSVVEAYGEYEFYLSIYENDSIDGTKEKLRSKDWSFFKDVSIVTEDINTQAFGSVKDATRVENLAKARNKAIFECGFLKDMDYVLMLEGDNQFTKESVKKLLDFKTFVPDFDVVSAVSLRKDGRHYDCWATRKTAHFNSRGTDLDPHYTQKAYGEYYSTSNGLCLYRAKPFQDGIKHGWINNVTNEFDCEMVVLCQNFRDAGYNKIYIKYDSFSNHE